MTRLELDPSWSIGGKPHGGYLLEQMVRPALDEAHPHPMTVSATYVASPDAGPAELDVERLRSGRRVASSQLRLTQSGAVRVVATLTSTRWTPDAPAHWSSPAAAPPAMAALADCPPTPPEPGGRVVGPLSHVDLRVDPSTTGWATGAPAGRGVVQGWVRWHDGRDADLADLLVFADVLPPVTFDLGLTGWVPTVELTVHLRGLPAPGWVRAVQSATLLQDGWVDEDCFLWDSRDRLVAQAHQLAGYRLPG